MLQKLPPGPPNLSYAGSLILPWRPILGQYKGTWLHPPDGFTLTFTYDFITGATTAYAEWDLGGDLDWGWYMQKTIAPPPLVEYENAIVDATFARWQTLLRITG